MRELEVLGNGHLRLDLAEWKEFFETEMTERLRSQLKALIEQALEAERDYHLQLNYYQHAPQCRLDYRNGYYFRDFLTRLNNSLGTLYHLSTPRLRPRLHLQPPAPHPPRHRLRQEILRLLRRRGRHL
ncbi:MAG TPA: transposase [Candidatus Acidoferrum sp.]|nr:transposase [Candidatus Acidoferrum sp.]